MVYCQIAQSYWVTEENLIKELHTELRGFRETTKGPCSNLGLATAITIARSKGTKERMVTRIQRG